MAQDGTEASGAGHGLCLRTMIEAMPSPVLLINRNQRIVALNQAFCDAAGRDHPFWLRTAPEQVLSGEAFAQIRAENERVFETGESTETEDRIRTRDGKDLHVLTRRRRIEIDGEPLVLTVLTDITDLRVAEARSRHLAYHDPLTGLPNRAALTERLDAAPAEDGAAVALLLIDLFQFKDINDAFGNGVGDALLQRFADRLASIARGSDRVARLGGDEFALLVPGCADAAAAEAACRQVLELAAEPFDVPAGAVSLDLSIGCAWSAPGIKGGAMLRRAEFALYEAKKGEGNAFRLFDGPLAAEAQARKMLEAELRAALAAGDQLDVYYQPVIDAGSEQVTAMEALVRWRHPRLGLMMPGSFIPLAESSGLIVPLGEWVLDRAAAMMVRFHGIQLAVNLSPIQLRVPEIDVRILAILARHGLPPQQLQLEITESAVLAMDGGVEARLARLREEGVQLVLDDFGTGYSSLSHLHRLSIDRVKIDQSFVHDLGRSQDARAIIQAVLGIGQSLGIGVTAEGVEEEAQRLFLRAFGCHEFQGHLFSRPLAPGDAITFLDAQEARRAA